MTQSPYALEIRDLVVNYGAIRALHGVSLRVPRGEIVTLIGSNGAGKTTTLRAISGMVRTASGSIVYESTQIQERKPHEIVSMGLAQVPEGRMVFPQLTVRENLMMGAFRRKAGRSVLEGEMEFVFKTFPRLKERLGQEAGTLSGGEQQMLAIGRALMSHPSLLMLDEPSLGIAPLLCKAIFEQIVQINRERGITILLVEQNANLALEISRYAYVYESGRVVLEGPAAEIRENEQVRAAYLGG